MEYIRKIRFDENFVVHNFNVVVDKEYMVDLGIKKFFFFFFLIGVNFLCDIKILRKVNGEERERALFMRLTVMVNIKFVWLML